MSPKTIKKLTDKKYRNETGLFIVEGEKNIKELLKSDFEVAGIFGTSVFLDSIIEAINSYDARMNTRIEIKEASESDVVRSGTLVTNSAGIAIAKQKNEASLEEVLSSAQENIVVALDDIRDPGNLGTILRIADWYGVTHIVASPTTTDLYNPKVISASMGSFTRVNVVYTDLPQFFEQKDIPVIVADLEGNSTHEYTFPSHGFLLLGSESHGVSKEALSYATERVMIPRFGNAESLNVSVAAGILLDTLRRPR